MEQTVVRITHNAGFFSCCSVRLDYIISFFNEKKQLPHIVDSSVQFAWYKEEAQDDITFEYFEDYNNYGDIIYTKPVNYHQIYQYTNYKSLAFEDIQPFIKKYFSPTDNIKSMVKQLENKYSINYDNICVLFYRGNDKVTETCITSYNDYIFFANEIFKNNPKMVFFIQSDETEFIVTMSAKFPHNSFYMKDEIRHIKKQRSTVDKIFRKDNPIFSKLYLAITIIMSKSKYIVCCAGNCSIWIMLYRGNCDNVYEYTNGQWIPSNINPPPPNVNVLHAKCLTKHCILLRHTDYKNNGGTHCCLSCKISERHGPACKHVKYII